MCKGLLYAIAFIPVGLCGAIFGLLRWQTCDSVPVQYLVFGLSCVELIVVGAMLTLLIIYITDKEDNDE